MTFRMNSRENDNFLAETFLLHFIIKKIHFTLIFSPSDVQIFFVYIFSKFFYLNFLTNFTKFSHPFLYATKNSSSSFFTTLKMCCCCTTKKRRRRRRKKFISHGNNPAAEFCIEISSNNLSFNSSLAFNTKRSSGEKIVEVNFPLAVLHTHTHMDDIDEP